MLALNLVYLWIVKPRPFIRIKRRKGDGFLQANLFEYSLLTATSITYQKKVNC